MSTKRNFKTPAAAAELMTKQAQMIELQKEMIKDLENMVELQKQKYGLLQQYLQNKYGCTF